MAKAKKETASLEELLEQAIVKEDERPYEVPGNWVWTRLGKYIDFATDFVANGSFASLKENVTYYKEENYALMVKTQDFANNFTKSLTYTDKKGYDFLSKSALTGGELILSNIGSVGKVFRVPYFKSPMTLASNSIMIKCYRELDYDYLFYLFLSPIGTELLESISSGTAVKKFNKTDLKTIPVPIAPLAEQQRIVEVIESLFENLDTAKELVQNALDSFESRKAAILHMAFTGELTAKWREENGVGFESWEQPSAKDICGFITKGETPTKFVSAEGEIPFLKVYNIRENKLDFQYNPAYIPKDIHDNKMKRSKVFPNDVIMNIVGPPLQKVAIVTDEFEEWNINQAIAIFRPKEKVTTKYLYYCLLCEDTLASVLAGVRGVVGQSNISLEQCRELIIPLPSIEEQQEIVRLLDTLLENEQRAKELCDVIEKIDHMKKAILARAFRGELGTNDPEEESAVELLKEVLKERL